MGRKTERQAEMVEHLLAEAQRFFQQGRLEPALNALRLAIKKAPREGRAYYLLAAVEREAGQRADALVHARKAVELLPKDPGARYQLAQALEDSGQVPAAIEELRTALVLLPRFPEAHHYLGLLLADTGQNAPALEAFSTALRCRPAYPRAWHNFGSLLRDLGRSAEAERAFREAIRLQPDYALAHASLGLLLRDSGRRQEAIASLRRSFTFQPMRIETVLALGNLLRIEGEFDEALTVYRSGLELDRKGEARVRMALAFGLAERGDVAEAKEVYRGAFERTNGNLRAAMGEALTLPPVYRDRAQIEAVRQEFHRGLDSLRQRAAQWSRLRRDELLHMLQWSNFYLAYQGYNDRPLQEQYSTFVHDLLETTVPEWLRPPEVRPGTRNKPRIGFISSFFTDSTVGHYFKRWVTELDSHRFEVFVYHLRPGSNLISEEIASRASVFRSLGSKPIEEVVTVVRNDELDVLIYPELGMDSACFLLAALRLARVQAMAWGHPVTSGHASIDYCFTSEAMEPPEGKTHYTEKLVQLPGIGTSYPRPPMPPRLSRKDLGLPEDGALLLVPQSLYKIHPDNDSLFAQILAQNAGGKLVLFQGRHEKITQDFVDRLKSAFTQFGMSHDGRLSILPYMPRERYLQVNMACDLMLDTVHWSGGNTSLDALACHLPIVTLPGALMRGRQSAAMLRLAGVPELVADSSEHYIEIALRLLADRAWREELVSRLAAGVGRLFDDSEPIEELDRFLKEAAQEGGAAQAEHSA